MVPSWPAVGGKGLRDGGYEWLLGDGEAGEGDRNTQLPRPLLVKLPDWTHFRSAEADPCGPCCLLPAAFDTNDLPRNYIWTIGYLGSWHSAEEAEISAQVRSYSREYLAERAAGIKQKKAEQERQLEQIKELRRKHKEEQDRLTADTMRDKASIDRRIEAGPLKMAKGLIQTAGQLASGGVTDPTARMEICNSCPFKGDDNRCGKCGCFLPAKTRVKKSSCPINRW